MNINAVPTSRPLSASEVCNSTPEIPLDNFGDWPSPNDSPTRPNRLSEVNTEVSAVRAKWNQAMDDGDVEAALGHAKQAAILAPNRSDGFECSAICLLRAGMLGVAEEYAEKARETRTGSHLFHALKAEAQRLRGNFTAALEHIEKVPPQKPSRMADVEVCKILCLIGLERFGDAEKQAIETTTRATTSPRALALLGWLYARRGERDMGMVLAYTANREMERSPKPFRLEVASSVAALLYNNIDPIQRCSQIHSL